MPFCISCGVRIPDGATKCAACEPAAAPSADKCPGCGAIFASPTSKFCMQCGQPRKAPAPQAAQPAPAAPPKPPKPAGRVCPNCGQPPKPANAKFCIYCASPLPQPQEPAPTPAPQPAAQATPQPAPPPPPEPPTPKPLTKEQKAEADTVAQARLAAYQKIGRMFLAACHTGQIDKASLPADLVATLDEAFTVVAKGHARLLAAGICPQCQDVGLDEKSQTCLKCGMKLPSGTKEAV